MATFTGTSAGTSIVGTRYADSIHSLGGNDFVWGNGGNDAIAAGTGDDYVWGGAGADQIAGGAGADQLVGDGGDIDHPVVQGADRIYGEAGNDGLDGGGGNDFLSGGDGNDGVDGGAGQDRISGGNGNDYLTDPDAATAYGDAGNDHLSIQAGHAYGGTGADAFNDTIPEGHVLWTGDADADQFITAIVAQDGRAGHITVTDFNPGQGDRLTIQADDQPSGVHFDQAAVLAAEDTNHDGRLSALQADGSGDLYVTQGSDGLSIHWYEDTVTIANMASIDLSMFG